MLRESTKSQIPYDEMKESPCRDAAQKYVRHPFFYALRTQAAIVPHESAFSKARHRILSAAESERLLPNPAANAFHSSCHYTA